MVLLSEVVQLVSCTRFKGVPVERDVVKFVIVERDVEYSDDKS